jgi:hypothetical protein
MQVLNKSAIRPHGTKLEDDLKKNCLKILRKVWARILKQPRAMLSHILHILVMKAPDGWKMPNFYKFSGEDNKITKEHISMFIAQLGDLVPWNI